MIGSIASSPAIDLSRLPQPDILAQPDFETRLAAKLARLVAVHPAFDALVESDPAIKLLEADAYDELVLARAMDDAARGLLIAFASGARLDHLAALFGVSRLTIDPGDPDRGIPTALESDGELRRRVQLAPHAFSVAGPELAYVYHARSADGDVLDASAVSPAPGEVVVTVLSRSGDGVPSPHVLSAVRTRLGDDVRPLTDAVTVEPVELIDFAISAALTVLAGPDAELIRQAALASLDTYLVGVRRLGRNVSRSGISAALHVPNVERVDLALPTVDLDIASGQLARPVAIDVTIAGAAL